jgi:hypothetical protein
MLAPFVWAGDALAATGAVPPDRAAAAGQFLASVALFPLVGALAVMMLYLCARRLGADGGAAVWLAVIFGAGTMHWQYSVNTYEESQIALCALTVLWAALRARDAAGIGWPLVVAVAAGVALAFRLSSVALTVPVVACLMVSDIAARPGKRLRRTGTWLLAGLLGAGPFAAALAWFNAARFGSWTQTGYATAHVTVDLGIPLAGSSMLDAVAGMWLSPGKSVILFSPAIVLGLVGLVLLWRKSPAVAAAITLAVAGTTALHGSLSWWAGDLAWGCRYLASSLGLLVLAALPLVHSRRRGWLLLVVIPSIVVQAASVTYSFALEFYQDRRHGLLPDGYVWRWDESQLVCRFRNVAMDLAGKPDYSSLAPATPNPVLHQAAVNEQAVRRMHTVNVFPLKARAAGVSGGVWYGLLAAWACIVVCFLAVAVHWIWSWRRTPKAAGSTDR